jgi:hypothetical protein
MYFNMKNVNRYAYNKQPGQEFHYASFTQEFTTT